MSDDGDDDDYEYEYHEIIPCNKSSEALGFMRLNRPFRFAGVRYLKIQGSLSQD